MVNYLVSQAIQRDREWLVRQMKRLEKQEMEEEDGGGDAVKEREKEDPTHSSLTLRFLLPFFPSLLRIVS